MNNTIFWFRLFFNWRTSKYRSSLSFVPYVIWFIELIALILMHLKCLHVWL